MKQMNLTNLVKDRISNANGKIGVYYCDLETDDSFFIGNTDVFESLGIAKLVMMIEVFNQIEQGKMSFSDKYTLEDDEQLLVCEEEYEQTVGILDFLHKGIELTIADLVKMMIIISDNAAFNVLYSLVGVDSINDTMASLGLINTRIESMLSEIDSNETGKNNYHSVKEIGWLLKMMYRGQLISQEASASMLKLLAYHQRRNTFSYYSNQGYSVMQQTGFDKSTLHTTAIVEHEKPFILCMSIDDVDIKKAENIMKDIAIMCGENI